jgi:hypothetical protein
MGTVAEKDLVEFVSQLAALPDNSRYGDLKGRVVADFGVRDPRLHQVLLAAGAARVLVTGMPELQPADDRIVPVPDDPLKARLPELADVAFLDARRCPGFDNVTSVTRFVEQLKRSLRPRGTAFAMLKTGSVIGGFDVYNSIVRSATELLPSNDYLFRDLLVDCATRIVGTTPTPRAYEQVRLLRLSLKLPTLLLILGRSHSGKTSLARDLLTLDVSMHVSNDYIYTELVAKARDGHAGAFPQELVRMAGDGSGKACGAFNRALEENPALLRQYLEWIAPTIPRNKRIVSMDFDLVAESQVELAKDVLSNAGFSVWVVRH